jgi:Icc-related predicted phosphoesterase
LSRTRIFFATDIHGSDRCFGKFLSAAKVYKANVLILGGDITGKMIVPIVKEHGGSYRVYFLGKEQKLLNEKELRTVMGSIKAVGYYPHITDEAGLDEMVSDPQKVHAMFQQMMTDSVGNWIRQAEERMKGSGVKCFISAGNDDEWYIDSLLNSSEYVEYPEGKVVKLDDTHEMASCGYTNMTPWKCPRDIPEDELGAKIESILARVVDKSNCILNFHCPPFGTVIDMAPKLTENLEPVLEPGGGMELAPVGSISVRQAIEKYQPLLSLHGHIHEAKGVAKIGRTVCINPGSEYTEGILKGFLAELDEKGIKDYIFTSG